MTAAAENPGAGALPLAGAVLRYQVAGTGPAVVLVHGFGLDMRMWDRQFAALAGDFRVVRYDCRGFGTTGPFDPAVPYTHAADLVALLDHLELGKAALVGLSFGGRVALQTALAAPDRVLALALLDAVLDGVPWDSESQDGLAEVSRQVAAGGVAAGRTAWLAHPLFAAARQDPALAGQLSVMVADFPGQHWLGLDPHRPDDPRPLDVLEQVTVPALVAAGEHDVPGFLAMTETLARRLPAAEVVLVKDAGHMVNMEQPDVVNDMLTQFLRRVSVR
jgi:3-oxoadipate enol-lactonase